MTELKNFFEGPINLDFMILGSLKNILQETEGKGMPKLKSIKNTARNFGETLVISQQATQILDQRNELERAYLLLKENVEPHIQKICLDEHSAQSFRNLMLKIETHMFAIREYKKMVASKQKCYIDSK